ncbi:hypothetical protein [Paludibacter sp.]|uniref:LA_2272 family surface repeat-containing protein n=1 Tax=Paludibacter sp. TaxID=1898105 RepID=UPI0013559E4C|nr:hypothetical protein [Paludibacter sp.]MTK52304.1 hypothetical protein [Paludibacter sp.]
MRKILILIFTCLLTGSLSAQTDIKCLNVSLWNPVAIVPYTYDNSLMVSVGLLQSKVNNLYGFSANGFSGITTGKMTGVQVAGFYSRIEGAAKGLTVSGLYNIHKASMSGVEIGSLANMNFVNQHGVQLSGVQNICMFNTDGLQAAALMNITGEMLSGVQIAGGFNVANDMHGVQLSGIVNFTLNKGSGIQLSGFNYATSMRGVQVGVANFARRMKGVQVGLVNYSADSSTLKIGLVSISPKTKIRPVIYYSNLATLNVGFRFMNCISYTILGLGTPYDAPHTTSSGMFFYRLGLYKQIGRLTLSSDAGASFISKFMDTGEKTALSAEGRVNFELALDKQVSVICSGGYSIRRFLSRKTSAELKPIIELGIVLPNLLKSSRL